MILDGGDGRETGSGPYTKTAGGGSNEGAVYVVSGSSSKVSSSGTLDHPVMYISLATLGSMILDVNGNRLDAIFLDATATVGDSFTLLKGPDTFPPTVISAAVVGGNTTVRVTFSEPIDPVSAQNPANYNLDHAASVTQVPVEADDRSVTLTTSPLLENVTYTLTINNVQDVAGNSIAPDTQTSFTFLNQNIMEIQIASDTDDAEERATGSVKLTSSDLELVTDGSNTQTIGLRFAGVAIPPGATIVDAYMQFQTDETADQPTTLTIQGQASDDTLSFSSSSRNISSRPRTTAAVQWAPEPWSTVGEAGLAQRTPNLAAIIQEVVDREGWTSGNAIVLIITGSGKRVAEAHDGEASGAARLHVEYTLASGGPPPGAPLLLAPADGASDLDVELTLSWDGVAETFNVEIASIADFSVVTYSVSQIAGSSLTVPAGILDFETTYYWRVQGANDGSTGPFSQIRSFTTERATIPPPAPALLPPSDNAVEVPLEPVLSWSGSSDSFDIEIALAASFTSSVFATTVTTSTSTIPLGTLAYETDYFWRVRGINTFGVGMFSTPFTFRTGPAPDMTAPSPPQNLSSPSQTGTTIDLAWDTATDNVGVVLYYIYQGGDKIASTAGTTFTLTNLVPGTSYDYQISAEDAAGNESLLSSVLTVSTQNLSAPVTISVQVSASQDDAEERQSDGRMTLTSSDLELIQDGSRVQVVGIRFRNVTIPAGAVVQEAYIQFTVDERNSGTISLEIRAQAADNAAAFTSNRGNISDRPTTTQAVGWEPPAWHTVGAAGLEQRTPDLSELIREIVGGSGWTSGNALVFLLRGTGERTAESFDGKAAAAPVLMVTYQSASGT